MTRHVLDDPGGLTERARRFLAKHSRHTRLELADGQPVGGPAGGRQRLEEFIARFGGLWFCRERPGCERRHRWGYDFNGFVESGWESTGPGDWVATVGDADGWPLTLDWTTGRIGIDVVGPRTWIAESAENLIESSALGQALRGDRSWHEVALSTVDGDVFHGVVPEVAEASSPWNRWYLDDRAAVHAWAETYELPRRTVVVAWYRDAEGRRRIESVAGPLRDR